MIVRVCNKCGSREERFEWKGDNYTLIEHIVIACTNCTSRFELAKMKDKWLLGTFKYCRWKDDN